MYSGATNETIPMHTPNRARPAINTPTVGDIAHTREPITNQSASSSMTQRRPNRSATRPPKAAPSAAPASAALVTTACMLGVRLNSVLRKSNAPEMIPVS
jgi:hypothetical protein